MYIAEHVCSSNGSYLMLLAFFHQEYSINVFMAVNELLHYDWVIKICKDTVFLIYQIF